MKSATKKALAAAGVALGSAALASLSAYLTTKYMLRMAIDREEPKLMKKAGELMNGSKPESEFQRKFKSAMEKLQAKENEVVEITAHDGERLVAHWIPQENAKRVIIAAHGWRSAWYRDFSMVSDAWEENGCSVLYIEQRGQNNSGGEYMGFGLTERYDCVDWVNWVIGRCGDSLPIYLCGVSMGATTVLMATGLKLPPNVHGVIADCGFTSPHAIWKHVANNRMHMLFGLRGAIADAMMKKKIQGGSANYSTVDALKTNRIPVIFIHGEADDFVPVWMTYENYEACRAPKKLLIVPGAGHGMSYYVDREGYENAVKEFWRECDGRVPEAEREEALSLE